MDAKGFFIIAVALALILASPETGTSGNEPGSDSDSKTVAASSTGRRKFPESRDLNVVLLVIDTLRAGHLPFYGYGVETAPFLSRLAKRGVVFENAISASSTTAPATASIFTSMYPSDHGVVTGIKANSRLRKVNPHITLNRIPESLSTLAEVFKSGGYGTYAVSDNLNISREMGYDRGFDKFQTYRYEGAGAINGWLEAWQKEMKDSGKYFLYIHYMDPHKPYHDRRPCIEKGAVGNLRAIDAYDSEIAFVDGHIEKIFALFGWSENALVVVTSDHGEEFGEHGNEGHGKSLYTEVVHVPFLICHPDLAAERRVGGFVHTMDILPTLADLMGLEKMKYWRGTSLVPVLNGAAPMETALFSELLRPEEHFRASRQAVIWKMWHLIRTTPRNGPGFFELYNLEDDFRETYNRFGDAGPISEELKAKLETFNERPLRVETKDVRIPIDQKTLNHLKSLGYVE